MTEKKLYIISADDDSDDQEFIQEALLLTGVDHVLDKVTDGDKLLKYLHQLLEKGSKFPDLIIIDLNMPVKSGRETLNILKHEASLFKSIHIVILTTSNSTEDIKYCLQNGATSFLVKPNSVPELTIILDAALNKISEPDFHKPNSN